MRWSRRRVSGLGAVVLLALALAAALPAAVRADGAPQAPVHVTMETRGGAAAGPLAADLPLPQELKCIAGGTSLMGSTPMQASETTAMMDPRKNLVADELLVCEVPGTSKLATGIHTGGQNGGRVYAVLGTVMVPNAEFVPLGMLEPRAAEGVTDAMHGAGATSSTLPSFDEWKTQHLEHERQRHRSKREKARGGTAANATAPHNTTKEEPPGARSTEQRAAATASVKEGAPRSADAAATPVADATQHHASTHADEAAAEPEGDAAAPPPPPPPPIFAADDPTKALAELRHRWNYASLDCAAVLHQANPSAKFPAAILSEKKDRYMLSPCPSAMQRRTEGDAPQAGEGQFVVVELCQHVRVDTIVLGNLEFFSSMFKRFQVRASSSLHAPETEWRLLGDFRARNVRGLQVFQLDNIPQSYFRYLRIDFLEHYGTEYYCPVSLLRVYGRNEREDADDDMLGDPEADAALEDDAEVDMLPGSEAPAEERSTPEAEALPPDTVTYAQPLGPRIRGMAPLEGLGACTAPWACTDRSLLEPFPGAWPRLEALATAAQAAAAAAAPESASVAQDTPAPTTSAASPTSSAAAVSSLSTEPSSSRATTTSSSQPSAPSSTWAPGSSPLRRSAPAASSGMPTASSTTQTTSSTASAPPKKTESNARASGTVASASEGKVNGTSTRRTEGTSSRRAEGASASRRAEGSSSAAGGGGSGESIFRTITKRLNALESNTSLSMQYLQLSSEVLRNKLVALEQTQEARVSQLLTALNASNWHQLEALRRRQEHDLRRALASLEIQRQRAETERSALVSRLHLLTEEIGAEKRRSVMQLVLLLALLLFIAATRGSSSAPLEQPGSTAATPARSRYGPRRAVSESEAFDRTPTRRIPGDILAPALDELEERSELDDASAVDSSDTVMHVAPTRRALATRNGDETPSFERPVASVKYPRAARRGMGVMTPSPLGMRRRAARGRAAPPRGLPRAPASVSVAWASDEGESHEGAEPAGDE